jgi:hypothetical protein
VLAAESDLKAAHARALELATEGASAATAAATAARAEAQVAASEARESAVRDALRSALSDKESALGRVRALFDREKSAADERARVRVEQVREECAAALAECRSVCVVVIVVVV